MSETERNLKMAEPSAYLCLDDSGTPYCCKLTVEVGEKYIPLYTDRILTARDAAHAEEVRKLKAAIAMKDEALKAAIPFIGYGQYVPHIVEQAEAALSTTPESIAAWEAEKLLPLQRQVAINKLIHESVLLVLDTIKKQGYPELQFILDQAIAHIKNSIQLSQATAKAYMAEHDAKVLEDAADQMEEEDEHLRCGEQFHTYAIRLRGWAKQLRATSKKAG